MYTFSKPQLHVLLFLCAFLVGLTGCTLKSKNKNEKLKEKESVVSKVDLSNIKVGYCTPSLNAPFYVALTQSIKKNVESYGMKFVSVDGQGDITKQITAIEDLVSKGINILIINPLDPKALVPTVNSISKSGIPVFIVDSYIEPNADYITSVLADNQRNGELLGEWVVEKMGKKKINAALISGAQGNPVGKEKRMGLIRGIAEKELVSKGSMDLNINSQGWGNWTNNGGLKAIEDILAAHPDINVLMAENDAMAMGALKAINEPGKSSDILIVGFDGQKEALEMIKADKLGATALNSPNQLGQIVVESIVKYKNEDKKLNKVIYTPAVLITKDNVGDFYDPKAIF